MLSAQERTKKSIKILSIFGLLITIALVFYGFWSGLFRSAQMMDEFLTNIGFLGVFIFILILIVQVVIPIMPGGIMLAVGVLVFGPVNGFFYNYIGIVIGSTINFLLARRYGKNFILSIVSKKNYEKYINWLDEGKRFDRFFICAILFPFAPDDFLCLLAGLTKMRFKKFMTIILLCKPGAVFLFSFGLSVGLEWISNLFV